MLAAAEGEAAAGGAGTRIAGANAVAPVPRRQSQGWQRCASGNAHRPRLGGPGRLFQPVQRLIFRIGSVNPRRPLPDHFGIHVHGPDVNPAYGAAVAVGVLYDNPRWFAKRKIR